MHYFSKKFTDYKVIYNKLQTSEAYFRISSSQKHSKLVFETLLTEVL